MAQAPKQRRNRLGNVGFFWWFEVPLPRLILFPMRDFELHPQLAKESHFIRDLPLSQLRLNNQRTVPWLILVPRRPEIREIYDLALADRAQLMEETTQAARALDRLYSPDKINVGALGNIVPQLHLHVIARYTRDPAWPAPVWGKLEPEFYAPAAIVEIAARLNDLVLWN